MSERTLFDDVDTADRPRTIQERFEAFHAANPDVYVEFRRLALDLRSRGFRHYGAKAIIEFIRFHRALANGPEEDFKINNVYTSRYVRLLVEDQPELAGFFEMRTLTAE